MFTADTTRCSPRRLLPSAEFRVVVGHLSGQLGCACCVAGRKPAPRSWVSTRIGTAHPRTYTPEHGGRPADAVRFHRGPSRDSQRLRSTPTATVLVTPGLHEGNMTLDEYQELAMRTHHNSPRLTIDGMPIYHCLGLAGEAGEFVDKVKKAWRNQTELDRVGALRELGDVLWYITAIAKDLGASLEDVAALNIAKLADRQARGVIKSEGDDR